MSLRRSQEAEELAARGSMEHHRHLHDVDAAAVQVVVVVE